MLARSLGCLTLLHLPGEVPPLTAEEEQELEALRQQMASAGGWGMFDPRTWAEFDPALAPTTTLVTTTVVVVDPH